MEVIKEVWKDIKGFEGMYQVSNMGNVRSLMFRNNVCQKSRIKILTQCDNGHGYLIVGLKFQGKRKNYYVHRLVATAFCNNPQNLNVVNHKDFDTKNNIFTNLEWCSTKENVQHSRYRMRHPKTLCRKTNTGEKYVHMSISNSKPRYRLQIKQLKIYKTFDSLAEAVKYRNEVVS